MARDIGPKIGIDGEAQYRKEIEGIIQQAKTLDAEMRAVASAFDDEADAQKKNKAISEQTAKQIEVQKDRIKLLQQMVARSAEATGENSTATLKWKEALANAQTQLNGLENSLDGTTKKTSVFGETLKAMLSKEAIIGSLTAIKDGIVELGKATLEFGKSVVSSYSDFEQLEGGVKKLFGDDYQAVIKNAQNGFKTAGLSANEYMETVTSFSASLINSLGGDTAEAAKLADRAIQDMSDNANTFGTDMQSIQSAYQGFAKGQFTLLDNLKLGYGGTKTEMERLITDAEKMNSAFKAQRDANGNLALSFGDIVQAIGIVQDSMNITGTTAKEASATIGGSIASMQSAWQNFVTGIGSSDADIDLLLNNLVGAFEDTVNNILPVVERMIDYIPGIIDAITPILQSKAPELIDTAMQLFQALLDGFIAMLPALTPIAVDIIVKLVDSLVKNLPTIIEAGIQLIIALINGLVQALPKLISYVPQIISSLVKGIITNLPQIMSAGVQLIKALIEGLMSMAGQLPEVIMNVLFAIKDTFGEGIKAALTWGKDMMVNFGNGIAEAASHVWNNVKGVASGIKKILGFSEPDEGPLSNFHTYAPDMMKLFAQGIKQNQHLVTDAASQAMQGVSNAMQVGGGTSNAYNYGGFNIVINQQPGQSADAVVDELMIKMQSRIDARRAVFAS